MPFPVLQAFTFFGRKVRINLSKNVSPSKSAIIPVVM